MSEFSRAYHDRLPADPTWKALLEERPLADQTRSFAVMPPRKTISAQWAVFTQSLAKAGERLSRR